MRSIIICVLFTAALKTSAQINIICPKLTDSTLNYFYIGVDNPIEIIGNKITDNYTVTISGGGAMITKTSANNYIVRATMITDDCRVVIIGKNGKIILKKDFKVRVIPDPVAQLGRFSYYEEASVDEILIKPFVNIAFPDCYYQYNIQIVSFIITVAIKDSIIEASTTGNQLSAKQVELIRNADKRSPIVVDNIRALHPEGRKVKFPSIVIYIK